MTLAEQLIDQVINEKEIPGFLKPYVKDVTLADDGDLWYSDASDNNYHILIIKGRKTKDSDYKREAARLQRLLKGWKVKALLREPYQSNAIMVSK